jgi:hypothetical protein
MHSVATTAYLSYRRLTEICVLLVKPVLHAFSGCYGSLFTDSRKLGAELFYNIDPRCHSRRKNSVSLTLPATSCQKSSPDKNSERKWEILASGSGTSVRALTSHQLKAKSLSVLMNRIQYSLSTKI